MGLESKKQNFGHFVGKKFDILSNHSIIILIFDPTPTQNEHFSPSTASDFMVFLELTSYPQRMILEQFLIDE